MLPYKGSIFPKYNKTHGYCILGWYIIEILKEGKPEMTRVWFIGKGCFTRIWNNIRIVFPINRSLWWKQTMLAEVWSISYHLLGANLNCNHLNIACSQDLEQPTTFHKSKRNYRTVCLPHPTQALLFNFRKGSSRVWDLSLSFLVFMAVCLFFSVYSCM